MSTSIKKTITVITVLFLLALQINALAGIKLASSTTESFTGSNVISGDWKAKIEGEKIRFQLSYEHPNSDGHSNISLDLEKKDIPDFCYDKEFTFQIKRECGITSFTGKFSGNKGKGEFEFTSDDNFKQYLHSKDFSNIKDEDFLIFFVFNITKDYISDLDKLGYGNISDSQLTSFAIFKVTTDFIKDIHAAGFKDISAQKLVDFKIFKVTPEFIKDISASGIKEIRPQNLIDFKIFNITDKFIQKVKNISKKKVLSAGYIVNAKIVGVRLAEDDEDDEDNS